MDINYISFARETSAHRVFLKELEQQLKLLSELKSRSSVGETLIITPEVKTHVHRLKGGAGFFGYDTIQSTAGELESLLDEPARKIERQKDLLSSLINQLEDLTLNTIPSE